MQFDLGFRMLNFITNKKYEFRYFYNNNIDLASENYLSKFSFLFFIYKYIIYIKSIVYYLFSLIKVCFWHIRNNLFYVYGKFHYGFAYPELLLKMKIKKNHSNIFNYYDEKSTDFSSNFQYIYIYKYIENILKNKRYFTKISGFVESYIYRNKNT
jgi:hypothetical protein